MSQSSIGAVAAAAATSKRTSSLRSIQNKFQNQFINNSSSKLNNASNTNSLSFARVHTPTKQQLQNHSLRIASLEQKQSNLNGNILSNTNYPTISIISQGPKQQSQSPLNMSGTGGYQPIYQRNSNSSVTSYSSMNKTEGEAAANQTKQKSAAKRLPNEDLIEQYDYI